MVKVTFSLDDDTVGRLRAVAARLRKPQSLVVREAVAEYAARADRLPEAERLRMLGILEALAAAPPARSDRDVAGEIAAIRRARRRGGRRHATPR
jgi:predicted transcriptional regulator